MANADDYARWIVANPSKRGTPEFNTVVAAYQDAKSQAAQQDTPTVQQGEQPSALASAGAGAGAEFGNIVLNGQKLLGKGIQKVDQLINGRDVGSLVTGKSDTTLGKVGNWLVNDAQQGQAKLKGENAPYEQAHPIVNKGAKFGTDLIVTAPVGGLLAKGARLAAPGLAATQTGANVIRAIETAGAQGGNIATRSIGSAINGAATAGMINPDDAQSGAMIGLATPGVLGLVGKAGSAAADLVRPNAKVNPLAVKAVDEYGIPLSIGDVTDSKLIKSTRSFLNDLPIIGRSGDALKEAQTKAFNKAVGGTFGSAEESLTPQVIDQAKKRLGGEFDRIWNNNALTVDSQMFQKVNDLDTLAQKLPKAEGQSLRAEIQDLLSKVQQDNAGNLIVPGETANKFQSYLRRRAEGSSGLKNELNDLRQTIIGAFNRSVAPQDAAALTLNRTQYKALKTVEPLLNSAEVGVAGRQAGDVPMALLPNAVNRSYSNPAGTPLADLSAIGSRFLMDRTPQTGGSARAMVQNGALGTMFGLGGMSHPVMAAGGLLGMGAANKALNSPLLARTMMRPMPTVNPGLLYQAAPLLGVQ